MNVTALAGWFSLERIRDSLRSQLWPVPALGVLVAIALGIGLPRLDANIDGSLPASTTTIYLFGGGPSAARSVLGAIAGSLITVTALTFSLTVVTLQLASSQFSPRLLRTFTQDRVVHATLALFLATFTYSLTVLRTIRDTTDVQDEFVPQISVTVAYLLALASVVGMVLFLAHLAREIRVETMLLTVHTGASEAIGRILSGRASVGRTVIPVPPTGARLVVARSSGFLVSVDEGALLEAAEAADAVVLLDRSPGQSVVAGTPMGALWPRQGDHLDPAELELLRERVIRAVGTGFERTGTQDIGYGLRQITDVATKALSPGINDPTTAVHALGHSAGLLCELARLDPGPVEMRDREGHVRVLLRRPTFADLLETALIQPRRYGRGDPLVLERLFTLLREVAWVCDSREAKEPVASQLSRLRATAQSQGFDNNQLSTLEEQARLVDEALHDRWPWG